MASIWVYVMRIALNVKYVGMVDLRLMVRHGVPCCDIASIIVPCVVRKKNICATLSVGYYGPADESGSCLGLLDEFSAASQQGEGVWMVT